MKHKVFFICGESGSGKDSLANEMCKRLNIKKLLSYTTRPKRNNEENTHTFIDKSEYQKYEKDIIAYTEIGEYKYFGTKQQLYESDIYIADYYGIKYIQNNFKDLDVDFVTIFINVPDNIREQRVLENRKDKQLDFYKRCFNENNQFKEMLMNKNFDYAIKNLDFNKTANILESIISTERRFNNDQYIKVKIFSTQKN